MQLRRAQAGFTLTEMAVVFAIVALLIGGAMMTLSARVEQRDYDETMRRLNAATDAVIAFAIVNQRLPCPARYVPAGSHSAGMESFCTAATGKCSGGETTTVQTHGNCSNFYSGFLPAASIGASALDSDSFAVDAWGNRIRYAVAKDKTGCTTAPGTNNVFTAQGNMKTYGLSCRPNDLDICTTAACAARVVSQSTAVFIVFSTGKNGAITSAYGADETENVDADAVFVHRLPTGSASALGTFDDLMVIVPVGTVYSKLISAGVLP
jgi:prepilin-type N-terminal cleavage/methylation domain-containing protein